MKQIKARFTLLHKCEMM